MRYVCIYYWKQRQSGYLFLQQLCTELRLDNICRNIRNHHKFTYDFHAIFTDLIYARILSPSSKLSSFSYCHSLLEPPKYSLQNLYRSLSVLAEESDYIQEELYQNSNFVHPRNPKILYYDCTNYYFETEVEDGIPLSFDLYPGSQNEQLTLKPLETKVIREMNMTLLSKGSGYIPSYKRTKLTDALHTAFSFRTDYEFISKTDMRSVIKETKQKNSTVGNSLSLFVRALHIVVNGWLKRAIRNVDLLYSIPTFISYTPFHNYQCMLKIFPPTPLFSFFN